MRGAGSLIPTLVSLVRGPELETQAPTSQTPFSRLVSVNESNCSLAKSKLKLKNH